MNKIEELEKMLKELYDDNNINSIGLNEIQNKLCEVAKEFNKLEEQIKQCERQVDNYRDECKTMRTKCDMYNSMLRGIVEDY